MYETQCNLTSLGGINITIQYSNTAEKYPELLRLCKISHYNHNTHRSNADTFSKLIVSTDVVINLVNRPLSKCRNMVVLIPIQQI